MLFDKNAVISPRHTIYELSQNPNYLKSVQDDITESGIIYVNEYYKQVLVKFDYDTNSCNAIIINYIHPDDKNVKENENEITFNVFNKNGHIIPIGLEDYNLNITWLLCQNGLFQLNIINVINFFELLKDTFQIPINPNHIVFCSNSCFGYSNILVSDNINFEFKNVLDSSKLNLYNFKDKLQELVKNYQYSTYYTKSNIEYLYKCLNRLNFNEFFYKNGNSPSDIANHLSNTIALVNSDIVEGYSILKSIDEDAIEDANREVSIQQSKKRFEFFKKFGDNQEIKNKFKTGPIKLIIKRNKRYEPAEIYGKVFGRQFYITDVFDFNFFERLLYICHKFESYETKIRKLILEKI